MSNTLQYQTMSTQPSPARSRKEKPPSSKLTEEESAESLESRTRSETRAVKQSESWEKWDYRQSCSQATTRSLRRLLESKWESMKSTQTFYLPTKCRTLNNYRPRDEGAPWSATASTTLQPWPSRT